MVSYLSVLMYGVGGIVVAGISLLVVFQEKLVYAPVLPGLTKASYPFTPVGLRLTYEDVWLTSSDGDRLHAWFIKLFPDCRGSMIRDHIFSIWKGKIWKINFQGKISLSVLEESNTLGHTEDGNMGLCIDYIMFNQVIVKNCHPFSCLINLEELLCIRILSFDQLSFVKDTKEGRIYRRQLLGLGAGITSS